MNIKTEWNLGLLYKGNNDPQLEKDVKKIEKAYTDFEKKYRDKPFTTSPKALLAALEEDEKISEELERFDPIFYLSLKTDLNSQDEESRALLTKYGERLTKAANKNKFFGLEIAKIPKTRQKQFLEFQGLKPYAYLLKKIFDHAKYNLSEKEEQLKSLLSHPAYGMWVDSQEKLLNRQTIEFRGKKISISEISNKLHDLSRKERHEAYNKITAVLKGISHMAEAEINAIYNYKKIMDELRGYRKSYSSAILGNDNNEFAIEKFVNLVTKNFKIAHRFYKLHAKLLKEKKLSLADRAVKMGKIKTKFDFKKSTVLLHKTLSKFGQEYANIFQRYLENGQFDVYPKEGKSHGAYCAHTGLLPVFILLNHVDDVRSLETLAHEMGHALHSEFANTQPVRYRGYSTATAEVASTFFEQMLLDDLEQTLSPQERIILLHNKLQGDIATIFRQIAFFNFEVELHERIRKAGQVSHEEIAKIMAKHLRSYLGDAFEVKNEDGYYFILLSHMRRFFYVYTYAYGQLISRALFEEWKKNKSFESKIRKFLSAGASMNPENIFKSIGIDTSKVAFFEAGLKGIEKDIAKLEKLSKIQKVK